MIIFGYYGTGKTEYCKHHPEAVDHDYMFYKFLYDEEKEAYLKEEQEHENKILFTNDINLLPKAKIIFLPESKEILIYNLQKRKTQELFTEIIADIFPDDNKTITAIAQKHDIPVIRLAKDEYISHYETLLKKERK